MLWGRYATVDSPFRSRCLLWSWYNRLVLSTWLIVSHVSLPWSLSSVPHTLQSYAGLAASDLTKCIQRGLRNDVCQSGCSREFLAFGPTSDIVMMIPTHIAMLTSEYVRCLWVLRLELSRKVLTTCTTESTQAPPCSLTSPSTLHEGSHPLDSAPDQTSIVMQLVPTHSLAQLLLCVHRADEVFEHRREVSGTIGWRIVKKAASVARTTRAPISDAPSGCKPFPIRPIIIAWVVALVGFTRNLHNCTTELSRNLIEIRIPSPGGTTGKRKKVFIPLPCHKWVLDLKLTRIGPSPLYSPTS